MSGSDRFRVARVADGPTGGWLLDDRGRVREWRSVISAVSALDAAGEDLAGWRIWWGPANAIGWRFACLASDAGYVFGGQ